jgi:acyl-CoA reductase-like NAD-dependent aldehyde dehydrogenase
MIPPAAIQFPINKGSALPRLIVLHEVYDTFVERFLSACPALPVGDPALPGTFVQMSREL